MTSVLDVADRLDIADLSARYAHHVDRREFASVLGLFTDDAQLVLPDPPRSLEPVITAEGWDAIADAMNGLGDIPVTMHALLGTVIDSGGQPDTATGWISAQANHVSSRGDKHRNLVWYLHYEDAYRSTGAGWKFTRRAVHIDWIETRDVRQLRDRPSK